VILLSLRMWEHTPSLTRRRSIMLRELLTGLAVVIMASSVIISSTFRSMRSDKLQLPVKNVNGSASITDKRDIPPPELESNVSDLKRTDI
jgi:hypothetical protein